MKRALFLLQATDSLACGAAACTPNDKTTLSNSLTNNDAAATNTAGAHAGVRLGSARTKPVN